MKKDIKSQNITLYNRYGYIVNLEPYEDNKWVLKLDDESGSYVRVGYKENKKDYYFVDPPGGPFLAVGNEIEGRKLTEIFHIPNVGFIFTLESPKSDNDEID